MHYNGVGWVVKPNKPTGRLKRWVWQPNLRRCKMQFCVTFSCISLYLIFSNGYHRKAATTIKNPRERQSLRGLMVGPVGFEPTTKGL